jgi:16S rRNA (cytidine1402-2'-O)-methyltransferase
VSRANQTDLESAGKGPGRLFVVSTPIGNLGDISERALTVLRSVDRIAAEDTRVTGKLLSRFGIETPMQPYHGHSDNRREEQLLDRLAMGERIALVSDAGTPCVSDPGGVLVAKAVERGIPVEPIPGASAILAALVASGIDPTRFVFEGFLPRTNDRRDRLKGLASEARTSVLYESPVRLVSTLRDLAQVCGDGRRCAVGRELTKLHEEFVRGTLADVVAHFTVAPPRGECVVVLEGATGSPPEMVHEGVDVDAMLQAARAKGLSAKEAAREVAQLTGMSRRVLYARLVDSAQDVLSSSENPAS